MCEISFELAANEVSKHSLYDCKFTIELKKIEKEGRVPSLCKIDSGNLLYFVEHARLHKTEANQLFNVNKTNVAFHRYKQAMRYVIIIECFMKQMDQKTTNEYKPVVEELKAQLYLNIAACQLKYSKENAANVLLNCTKCIELNRCLTKAYHRRSQAHCLLSNYESAKKDLESALAIETTDKNYFREKIKEIDKKTRELV
jgi:hypothetical protein